jgi:hypothetical protein
MTDLPDVWLDFAQAAALIGMAAPRFARVIDQGTLRVQLAPSGTRGVMKSDLLSWRRVDRDAGRAALVDFAAQVDREIFR